MKTTITTLVLLDNIQEPLLYPVLYHSLEEDPEKAKKEIIQQVNDIYDSILDEFSSIEQIKAHFKHAYLERHQILPTKTKNNIHSLENPKKAF